MDADALKFSFGSVNFSASLLGLHRCDLSPELLVMRYFLCGMRRLCARFARYVHSEYAYPSKLFPPYLGFYWSVQLHMHVVGKLFICTFFLISICINNRILVQTMRIPYIQARKTCFPHISTPINRFSFICMSLETHLSVLTAFLKPRQAGSFSRGIYSILQNDFRRKLHCLVLF